jgi:hypothetical protein
MTVDELCEEVLRLKPNSFMALNGAAAGIIGSSDSGTDTIAQLQRATLQFAQTYKDGDAEALATAKREVIGKVMVAMTMDAITEEKADMIAEAVVELTKGKK